MTSDPAERPTVVSIHIASAAAAAMIAVDEIRVVAGRGLAGDRYF